MTKHTTRYLITYVDTDGMHVYGYNTVDKYLCEYHEQSFEFVQSKIVKVVKIGECNGENHTQCSVCKYGY